MNKKVVLFGCGGCLLCCLIVGGVFILLVANAMKEPEGMVVKVEAPLDAALGERFDLVVKVVNERAGKALTVGDVDLGTGYIDGFTVISTDPKFQSSQRLPLIGLSHTFALDIPAGQSREFKFTLRAEKPGIHRGDVDVYEGTRSITSLAQTVVREKGDGKPKEKPAEGESEESTAPDKPEPAPAEAESKPPSSAP